MRYFLICFFCLVACGDDENPGDAAVDISNESVDATSEDAPLDVTVVQPTEALFEQEQKYVTLYCECSDTPDCENLSIINHLAAYSSTQLECIKNGVQNVHTIQELGCFTSNLKAITDCMESRTCSEDRFSCINEDGAVCSGDTQKLFAVTDEVKTAANMGCSEPIP